MEFRVYETVPAKQVRELLSSDRRRTLARELERRTCGVPHL